MIGLDLGQMRSCYPYFIYPFDAWIIFFQNQINLMYDLTKNNVFIYLVT